MVLETGPDSEHQKKSVSLGERRNGKAVGRGVAGGGVTLRGTPVAGTRPLQYETRVVLKLQQKGGQTSRRLTNNFVSLHLFFLASLD